MKQRPILFSAPMVRALLDGSKTQTRRVVKPEGAVEFVRFIGADNKPTGEWGWCPNPRYITKHIRCPYGQPGDQLWVREAWSEPTSLDPGPTFYRADYPACVPAHFENVPPADAIKWKPSIHMRRDQCRITLEIVSVRVERLQDISEADAIAEGCKNSLNLPGGRFANENYRHLWQTINGDGSWYLNPWVWVVEFKALPCTNSLASNSAPHTVLEAIDL